MYTREIVCLANSYKHRGWCIAGREYRNGAVGTWLRPVSVREGRGLSDAEIRYGLLRGTVSVGDIADVRLVRPVPEGHQCENHEIAGTGVWRKSGCTTWTLLYACVDRDDPDFWVDYGHSSRGHADRIPDSMVPALGSSLKLICLRSLDLWVGPGRDGRKEVRACFTHLGMTCRLKVTDPVVCGVMVSKSSGYYPWGMAMLCISITEPLHGFVYRIVASIITPRRCESFRP